MKNIITVVILFILSSHVFINAQSIQGRFLLGASSAINIGSSSNLFGFENTSSTNKVDTIADSPSAKINKFYISPKIGYCITDYIAVGIDFDLSYSKYKYLTDNSTNSIFGVGPFFRWYMSQTKVVPIIEFSASWGQQKVKETSIGFSSEESYSLFKLGGGVGAAITIGEHVHLDVMALYNSITTKPKEDNEYNNRRVDGKLGLYLGIMVLL